MIAELATALVLWVVPTAPAPLPPTVNAGCPAEAMWACYEDGKVYIPADLVPGARRFTLEHEYGHAYAQQIPDGPRRRIALVMGWKRWRGEAFADFYAGCRLALDSSVQGDVYGPFRSMRRIAARCRLISRAGTR